MIHLILAVLALMMLWQLLRIVWFVMLLVALAPVRLILALVSGLTANNQVEAPSTPSPLRLVARDGRRIG